MLIYRMNLFLSKIFKRLVVIVFFDACVPGGYSGGKLTGICVTVV